LKFTKTVLQILREQSGEVHFESELKFIKQHNGLRPGEIHLFLGPVGEGKSTLNRTVIIDFLVNNPGMKILLWLSEETEEKYAAELSRSLHAHFDRIEFVSERTMENIESEKTFFARMEEEIKKSEARIVFFDNITTSKCYGNRKNPDQSRVADKFKKLAEKMGIAVILIAHTKKGIHSGRGSLIESDDIRGDATIVNVSEFLYILQQFSFNDEKQGTIRITKYRGQDIENSTFFLVYNRMGRFYCQARQVSFSEFKKKYAGRDRL
jgi:archaellum biogenesis ATPase FlaH